MSKKSGSGAKKSGSEAKKEGSGSVSASASSAKAPPVKPERWGEEPDEHDYPAAASFLSLICDPTEVRRLVTALKAAPIVHHQAKDLLRASGLALLPTDNFHVASDLAKVARGERLSPVLLMRGDFRRGVPLTIADGYHRVCASYHLDENADIPCHLVDHKGPTAVPGFRLGSGVDAGTGPEAGSGGGTGAGSGAGAGTASAAGAETGKGIETGAGLGTTAPANAGSGSSTGSPGGSEAPGGS
jgi:hypothetical protein